MLSAGDANYWHWAQNLSLIALSIILLPVSTTIVAWAFIFSFVFHRRTRNRSLRSADRKAKGFAGLIAQSSWLDDETSESLDNAAQASASSGSTKKEKAILVTGVSMTKGLTLVRLLAKHTQYRVIGADTSRLAAGRFSRFSDGFFQLAAASENPKDGNKAYKESLLSLIRRENVGLWVSCSGVMSAVEDAEVREELDKIGRCKSIQFGIKQTRMLHEKEKFGDWLRDNGFLTPETITITSQEQVLSALYPTDEKRQAAIAGRKYILKPTGVDDTQRADMTLLPMKSRSDTRSFIKKKPINKESSWILQEFIKGEEFCTHALIVRGQVRNFVACPSAELLMHYKALPTEGRLSQAMLKFTRKVAGMLEQEEIDRSRGNNKQRVNDANGAPGHFTGHLSFDFFVKQEDLNDASKEPKLYPIECNPRAHTAVCLFRNTPESVAGYVEVMQEQKEEHSSYRDAVAMGISEAEKTPNVTGDEKSLVAAGKSSANTTDIVYPYHLQSGYWLAHDLVELLIIPALQLLTLETSIFTLISNIKTLLAHVLFWRDAQFDVDDPVPAWVLYQLFWPFMFFESFKAGKKWSRVNVSTGKMFGLE